MGANYVLLLLISAGIVSNFELNAFITVVRVYLMLRSQKLMFCLHVSQFTVLLKAFHVL